jgi:signal transduction histidine kinase
MLHEFLTQNRPELLARCAVRVAARRASAQAAEQSEHGIPLFLDQLIRMLQAEVQPPLRPRRKNSHAPSERQAGSEMAVSATRHGRELMRQGFTVEQVVRDYGDLCQEITGLAMESDVPIRVDEFRMLNRCLDNGIAEAVTEFAYQRDSLNADKEATALNQRLGFLAHELRNLIYKATLAITVIKTGKAGLGGATGAILDRSLVSMTNLIDRSLAEVRMAAGMPARYQLISVADFIADVGISASLEADVHECTLVISAVDPTLAIDADREMLFAAVGNLLQNAFKFTAHRTEVKLSAYAEADRILISVEDSGSGLAPGEAETIFQPFTQSGADKSGVGLGLAIVRRSTEINNGVLTVRNVPGSGCVFTIDLPRQLLPI